MNVLEKLFEISLHIDVTTNITELIHFLATLPKNLTFNIIGNMGEVPNYSELLSYLDQYSSPKNLLCSYKNVIALQPIFENNFSCQISVSFPIDVERMNMYDFGKINIMPNGDASANNIHEILHKEVEEGKSWLRVRNQVPCTDCVYQWICPPPSNYEITVGRPNLCHVKE